MPHPNPGQDGQVQYPQDLQLIPLAHVVKEDDKDRQGQEHPGRLCRPTPIATVGQGQIEQHKERGQGTGHQNRKGQITGQVQSRGAQQPEGQPAEQGNGHSQRPVDTAALRLGHRAGEPVVPGRDQHILRHLMIDLVQPGGEVGGLPGLGRLLKECFQLLWIMTIGVDRLGVRHRNLRGLLRNEKRGAIRTDYSPSQRLLLRRSCFVFPWVGS